MAKPKPKVLEVQSISDRELFDHPNNTNKQDKHTHQALMENITKHGFDEPLLVVPRTDGPGYYIVSGNHRRKAGRALGMTDFPAIVHNEWDEIEARLQLVRRNYSRGKIDQDLFTQEVNALKREHALPMDIIMDQMGFKDHLDFAELYKAEEAKKEQKMNTALSNEGQKQMAQIKMVSDIGVIVSQLFEKYGQSVPQSFMIFPVGGKNMAYIAVNAALKKSIDVISTHCVAKGLDINIAIAGLLQIGLQHSSFLKGSAEAKEKVIQEGSITGDTDLALLDSKDAN
jgi:hypothetical protein